MELSRGELKWNVGAPATEAWVVVCIGSEATIPPASHPELSRATRLAWGSGATASVEVWSRLEVVVEHFASAGPSNAETVMLATTASALPEDGMPDHVQVGDRRFPCVLGTEGSIRGTIR